MNDESKYRVYFRFFRRWCIGPALVLIAIPVTLVLAQAFGSRKMPDLEPWHHHAPTGEFTKADLEPGFETL